MNQFRPKASHAVILLLVLVGTLAILFAFWLIQRPQGISRSGILIATSFGAFFVSYTWALLLYLRRRDKNQAEMGRKPPQTPLARPELEGTIYGMVAGRQYQIMKSCTDYYGNSFEQGETLGFKERYFLPYEGGHTVVFEQRSLYLQEDKHREILDRFSEYIVQIT